MRKKAQAAMEFLMTYGWAILVVLVAIGALAYFGVLSPSKFLPQSCTIGSGISCNDFKVSTDQVQLVMRNGFGSNLDNVTVTIAGCTVSTEADGGDTWTDGSVLGDTGGITLTGCSNGAAAARFKEDVNIVYTSSSGVTHNLTGQITGKVE
jgi:hypothetical protein